MMMIKQLAVPDISIYICLIDIKSKSKEQLNERRAGLSNDNPVDGEELMETKRVLSKGSDYDCEDDNNDPNDDDGVTKI